jgi:hypothetical protein
MSASPYGNTPGGQWPPPPGPPQCPPPGWPAATPRQPRLPVIISLVVALAAIAVAVGAWFRPATDANSASPPDSKSQFSEEQIADAKEAVCDAYDKTYKAVATAGRQQSDDPTLEFVISVNTRLATQFSSRFLSDVLEANPATPADLASHVRGMTSAWDNIVLLQLAGNEGDGPAYKPYYADLDSSDTEIAKGCE